VTTLVLLLLINLDLNTNNVSDFNDDDDKELIGVTSYGALGHVPPRLPTV